MAFRANPEIARAFEVGDVTPADTTLELEAEPVGFGGDVSSLGDPVVTTSAEAEGADLMLGVAITTLKTVDLPSTYRQD